MHMFPSMKVDFRTVYNTANVHRLANSTKIMDVLKEAQIEPRSHCPPLLAEPWNHKWVKVQRSPDRAQTTLFPHPHIDKIIMHRVLCIPEMLEHIFGLLPSVDQLSALLVNKQWSGVAIRLIWKTVEQCEELLDILHGRDRVRSHIWLFVITMLHDTATHRVRQALEEQWPSRLMRPTSANCMYMRRYHPASRPWKM